MGMDEKTVKGAVALIIMTVMVVSVGIPIILTCLPSDSGNSINNEGAGWVRFALDKKADTDYTISYLEGDEGLDISNGEDTQTLNFEDVNPETGGFETIIYAGSTLTVWLDTEAKIHVLGMNNDKPNYIEGYFTEFTISKDSEGVTVTPRSYTPLHFDTPEWAYIPNSTGNYGFFAYDENSGVQNPSGMPIAVVGGGFAGVYAYNDLLRYDGLGLEMTPITDDDGLFYGGTWNEGSGSGDDEEQTDTSNMSITPLDPNVITPTNGLMAVPTPTYTDGDWGYDRVRVDGVWKAKIVSYTGAGGTVTVPATIGGDDVYAVGKGSTNSTVFDNTLSITKLIISDGIKVISSYAFDGCNRIESVEIPTSVTTIDTRAFRNCSGLSGSLEIPSGVTTIGNSAFESCVGMTGQLVIPSSVTTIGSNAFKSCKFTGPLDLPSSLTDLGSNAFYECNGFTGTLEIPSGITTIPGSAFYNCTGFNALVIPSSVTSIGGSAFTGCGGLTGSLVIPANVTYIGSTAFSNTGFTSIVITSKNVTIDANAFYNCTEVKSFITCSDVAPPAYSLDGLSNVSEILDLSDEIDYSANHYGLPASATVSESIGDCFGYISVTEYTEPPDADKAALSGVISLIPVLMIVGLVIAAIGVMGIVKLKN